MLGEILANAANWNDAGRELQRRRRLRVEHVQTMTDRLSRAARLPPWLRDPILRVIGPHSYRATYGPLRATSQLESLPHTPAVEHEWEASPVFTAFGSGH